MGLIHNFGIYDVVNGHKTKEYSHWQNMLKRCYCPKFQERHPSYKGCEVSNDFKRFSDFANWCKSQHAFGEAKVDLDKDLLVKGNKLYSKKNCVFIPQELNKLLIQRSNERGLYPIGSYFDKKYGKIKAQINMNKKKVFLGYYDNPIDAFIAYKKAKESHIKELANIYKSKLDPRAYDALMAYSIEMKD